MAAVTGLAAPTAAAFGLKETPDGKPLRWAEPSVSYVVDPSLAAAVASGSDAATSAVAAWSGTKGGPALSASVGPGGAKAGLDGQNSILYAPGGFAPAGGALAVTVTSYDQTTGAIVDTDIVVNGVHPFAVLAAGAEPAAGSSPVATDGAARPGGNDDAAPFDLVHVLAHEVGHSLGLADERADTSALMYAFTTPGDASVRAPSSDDIDGVAADYGSTATGAAAAAANPGGCSVASASPRASGAWIALMLAGGAGVWAARRRRGLRVAVSAGAVVVVLAAAPEATVSASPASVPSGAASARVLAVSTTNAGGLFESTVDLAPTVCAAPPCPERASAHVWGGTVGGITQEIGGVPVPSVGDVVTVAFDSRPADLRPGAVIAASLVGARR